MTKDTDEDSAKTIRTLMELWTAPLKATASLQQATSQRLTKIALQHASQMLLAQRLLRRSLLGPEKPVSTEVQKDSGDKEGE